MIVPSRYDACTQVAPLRAACPPTTRFIMVTATLAAQVFAQLTEEFPGILPAFGPGKRPMCLYFSCVHHKYTGFALLSIRAIPAQITPKACLSSGLVLSHSRHLGSSCSAVLKVLVRLASRSFRSLIYRTCPVRELWPHLKAVSKHVIRSMQVSTVQRLELQSSWWTAQEVMSRMRKQASLGRQKP